MKTKLFSLLMLATLLSANAASYIMTFTWEHSPTALEDPDGDYVLYQQRGSGPFVPIAVVPGTTNKVSITNVNPGAMRFYVVYRNIWGVSEPSSTLKFPPYPMRSARFEVESIQ